MTETLKIPISKLALTAVLLIIIATIQACIGITAYADESYFDDEAYAFNVDEYDCDDVIILDDPIYFMGFDDEDRLCDVPTDIDPEPPTIAATTPQPAPSEAPEPSATAVPSEAPEPSAMPIPSEAATPRPSKKEPLIYEIPQDVLAADEKFAALMAEATKYIGYPYVWGGHSPATSFDCSGFVSYVFTFSGVCKTGGRGATGLYSICEAIAAEEARPGDLIFFEGTMGEDVDGITHVGIYVGNNMMLHCGNPIGYADLTEPFWQAHFYGYGRLPY